MLRIIAVLALLLLTSDVIAQDLTFETATPAKVTVDWKGKITIEKAETPPPFNILQPQTQPEVLPKKEIEREDGFKPTISERRLRGRRILYFTADWCPPCKIWDDTIPRLKQLGEIKTYKMSEGVQDSMDPDTRVAIKHGVDRLPCFILQDDNEPKWEVYRTKRVTERELADWLQGNLFIANYQRRTP